MEEDEVKDHLPYVEICLSYFVTYDKRYGVGIEKRGLNTVPVKNVVNNLFDSIEQCCAFLRELVDGTASPNCLGSIAMDYEHHKT